MSYFCPGINKGAVAQFVKENGHFDIVRKIKEANKNKDMEIFVRYIRVIDTHLHATETIKLNSDYWNDCGCADCNMWKDHYEEMLMAGIEV